MAHKTVCTLLAHLVAARLNCITSKNDEWKCRHEDRIRKIAKDFLPSGSGFDNGTRVDLGESKGDRLVLTTAFHHMTEGTYSGWTEHNVIVTPSFIGGLNLRVTGRDRDDIKDYIGDACLNALVTEVEEHKDGTVTYVPAA